MLVLTVALWIMAVVIKNDKKQSTVLLKEQEALLFLLHIR